MSQSSLTKSIDVGSMFLMDLSVNESLDQAADSLTGPTDAHQATSLTAGADNLRNHHHSSKYRKTMTSSMSANHCHRPLAGDPRPAAYTATSSIADHQMSTRAAKIPQSHYLGSSLDRIASAINNCDGQQSELVLNDDELSVTIVEPQPIEDYNEEDEEEARNEDEEDEQEYEESPQSSYTFSDESLVDSSRRSLSPVRGYYSNLAFNSQRNNANDNEDRDSTTTREDSGVLDMKDLAGQLHNSYDNEITDDDNCHRGHKAINHNQRLEQEKPISNNIMATNLIISSNKSALGDQQRHQTHRHPHRFAEATGGLGDGHYGSGASTTSSSSSSSGSTSGGGGHNSYPRRSVSASLPIQVPVRQMRKDLNKMKLKLMKEEMCREQNSRLDIESDQQQQETNGSSISYGHQQLAEARSSLAWDDEDDDTFLEQEYNDNHHNHYPINEHDDEHLRADEDPMRLFASIQALAKSLHEDAELFGSLPPKRLVESPVRSLALV